MKNILKIGIIVGVIVIAIGLSSPLFYETQVNEPLPQVLNRIEPGLTYEKFVDMNEEVRKPIVEKMPEKVKEMIMEEGAIQITTISEEMQESGITIIKAGKFEGLLGHYASGTAKIIKVGDEIYLRFEDFEVTNGPDLRVYLTVDGNVRNGVHIDKLKGSKGDQNYLLQEVDVSLYNTAVVYCQPFGVHFGQAKLS